MFNQKKSEMNKTLVANRLIFSQEKSKPTIFILESGKLAYSFKISLMDKEYKIKFLEFSKKQYFGYESFLPRTKGLEIVTIDDSTLSFFPLNDFDEIVEYNLNLFSILFQDVFFKIKKLNVVINQLIKFLNGLYHLNIKVANLIKQLGLEVETSEKCKSYYQEIEGSLNIDSFKDFISLNLNEKRYRELFFRNNFIFNDFFEEDIITDFIPILEKKKKIGRSLFEMQLQEVSDFYLFLGKSLRNLHHEFSVLYIDNNSFIKTLKKKERVIPTKFYNFFFDFSNYLKTIVFSDPFLKNFIEEKGLEENFSFNLEEPIKVSSDNFNAIPVFPLEVDQDGGNNNQEEHQVIQIYLRNKQKENVIIEDLRLIKSFNANFIQNTKKIFLKKFNEQVLTNLENDFFRYGICRSFLNPDQIDFIKKTIDQDVASQGDNPNNFHFFQWLQLIREDEEEPSNNDLGISFRKYLFLKKKFKGKKKLTPLEDKIYYEVENMYTSVLKIFNRNPINIYPLNKALFPSELQNHVITSEKINSLVNEIKSKDFTVFYRETIFTHKNKNQIIQYEVMPKFIILPVISERIVFWQEMVDNRRKTSARFFLPLFYIGMDLRKDFINAIASYRWELCRSIKGFSWLDPVDGGITGGINDYIAFYKKNTSLSIEQKEKVSHLIKKFRTDYKKIFSYMYYTWLEFESKGIIRLNDFERGIFFKNIPFCKEVRDKLENIPLFKRHLYRYKNLATKKYEVDVRKFKDYKYKQTNKILDEIQKHFDLYIM